MQETIEGLFDGKRIVPLGEIRSKKPRKVQITFGEEVTPEEETRMIASYSDAFEFWNNPEEDLYQDYLPDA